MSAAEAKSKEALASQARIESTLGAVEAERAATKTEFAEPVAGDDAEMALLRPMLKNTNLEYLVRLMTPTRTNGRRGVHSRRVLRRRRRLRECCGCPQLPATLSSTLPEAPLGGEAPCCHAIKHAARRPLPRY